MHRSEAPAWKPSWLSCTRISARPPRSTFIVCNAICLPGEGIVSMALSNNSFGSRAREETGSGSGLHAMVVSSSIRVLPSRGPRVSANEPFASEFCRANPDLVQTYLGSQYALRSCFAIARNASDFAAHCDLVTRSGDVSPYCRLCFASLSHTGHRARCTAAFSSGRTPGPVTRIDLACVEWRRLGLAYTTLTT